MLKSSLKREKSHLVISRYLCMCIYAAAPFRSLIFPSQTWHIKTLSQCPTFLKIFPYNIENCLNGKISSALEHRYAPYNFNGRLLLSLVCILRYLLSYGIKKKVQKYNCIKEFFLLNYRQKTRTPYLVFHGGEHPVLPKH